MARIIQQTLLSARDLVITLGPFLLIAIGLLVGAYYVLDPTPPKRVVPQTSTAPAPGSEQILELSDDPLENSLARLQSVGSGG